MLRAVKWAPAAALVVTAALWSQLGPFGIIAPFAVLLGGIALMLHCFGVKQYAFAAVFGLLALIYNPVAPLFTFDGEWQRAFVFASATPFIIAAVASRSARTASR